MDLSLSGKLGQLLSAFILVMLPLIILLFGVITNILNVWFYVILITWFGLGLILFLAIRE